MDQLELSKLTRAADVRSQINEKLLKALLALLALKDEHLLEELCIIFDHAQERGGEIGQASPEVWAGVNHHVSILKRLAASEDEAQIARKGAQAH